MFTFSYSFRPWRKAKAIVEAPCILQYIRDTAREHGIVDKFVSIIASNGHPGHQPLPAGRSKPSAARAANRSLTSAIFF
jgi:hypothetical protein